LAIKYAYPRIKNTARRFAVRNINGFQISSTGFLVDSGLVKIGDNKMTCSCVPCKQCNGTGTIWISFSGEYLGSHRCDDLDEMDGCEFCDGTGVESWCDECTSRFQDEQDAEWRE
jgi:hypothetical protein